MKISILGLFLFCLPISILFGQDYWSKSYDPFMHEHDQIMNITVSDSIIYASARGTCLKDSVPECFKILKFDLEGNLLDGYEDPSFENGFGMELDEDWIYVDGGNEPLNSLMKITRISKDFSESQTIDAKVPNGRRYANRSCISNSKHIIGYGTYLPENSISPTNGIQVWVNKETFTVDTIITFAPTGKAMNILNMTIDDEGFSYLIAIDDELNEHGIELNYHRIIKQDSVGNIVWDYGYKEGFISLNNWPTSILVKNEKIYFLGLDSESYASIISINKEGGKLWEYVFEHDFLKDVLPLSLKLKSNNNILIAGTQRDGANGWVNVGFISEIDADNGELLWEHVFEVDKGEDEIYGEEFSKSNVIRDVEELANGDLLLGGLIQEIYDDPIHGTRHDDDLWLLKLNENGCLIDNCGYLQSINNGELLVDTCKWLKTNAAWCYSQWELNPNQDLAQVDITGDTLVGNRLCSVMNLYDEGVLVEESKLICFYEEENEFVYFYEDEEFKLLYDFSFSVLPGDTVEFFMPRNFSVYDISSGQGSANLSSLPLKYRYVDQDWVELSNGELHRVVHTEPILNNEYECFNIGSIIDGVGSSLGLLGRGCIVAPSGWEGFFRNFESTDLTYTEVEGCIVTSTSNPIESTLDVYPNPASYYLHIQSSESEINRVVLYNSLGQKVLDKKVQGLEVELLTRDYGVGVYWLDVELYDGSSYREKILILEGE